MFLVSAYLKVNKKYGEVITQPIEEYVNLLIIVSDCQIINNYHHVPGQPWLSHDYDIYHRDYTAVCTVHRQIPRIHR